MQQAAAGVSRLSSAASVAREKQKAEMLGAPIANTIVFLTINMLQASSRKSEIHFLDCLD